VGSHAVLLRAQGLRKKNCETLSKVYRGSWVPSRKTPGDRPSQLQPGLTQSAILCACCLILAVSAAAPMRIPTLKLISSLTVKHGYVGRDQRGLRELEGDKRLSVHRKPEVGRSFIR